MKTKVYAVFDVKAACYGTPFFMVNDAMALRSFIDFTNDDKTMINRHPEDFSLYGIGSYEDDTALISGVTPWVIATAASVWKAKAFKESNDSEETC